MDTAPTTQAPQETPSTGVPAGATPPPPASAEPSMESLLGGGSTWTPAQPAVGDTPLPVGHDDKKKNKKRGMLVAIILLLLLTLPIIGYFGIQQSQDIRDRAAYPTGGACAGVLANCTPGATSGADACCSGQNLYCQTPAGGGQAKCQQDDGSGSDCGTGGSCTRFLAFKCGQLSGGKCSENPQIVSSWSAGVTYAAGCGQVDKVCAGGPRENTLCGDFQIFGSSCSGGGGNTPTPTQPSGNTPTHTPTRTPTPTSNNSPTPTTTTTATPTPTTITGQCDDIKIYKGNAVVNPNTLRPGDQIVIAVVGTNATKARVRVNGGAFTETSTKNNANEYTLNFTIPASGTTTFTVEAELFIADSWR